LTLVAIDPILMRMDAVRNIKSQVRRRQIWTDDGIRLSLVYQGDVHAPCVLLAHGFGQTQWAWSETARLLAESGWQAVTYDARGHGESDRARDGDYEFEAFVEDFRRVCDCLPGPPVVVGASMGGLTAMIAHTERPRVDLAGMVLVDIAPSWDTRGVSSMLDFMRQHPEGFESLDQAREAIRHFLPHRRNKGSMEGLKRNLRQASSGRWHWHWDPAMLPLAEQSEKLQRRLKNAAKKLKLPTLLVSGGASEMIGRKHIEEFGKLVPHAGHEQLADARHMVAGDSNEPFLAAIGPFLNEVGSTRGIQT